MRKAPSAEHRRRRHLRPLARHLARRTGARIPACVVPPPIAVRLHRTTLARHRRRPPALWVRTAYHTCKATLDRARTRLLSLRRKRIEVHLGACDVHEVALARLERMPVAEDAREALAELTRASVWRTA